jgi:hypothetical protein
LIQLAGAFVHFQKQALYPDHPTHGKRSAPGKRLLVLASDRLSAFPDRHLGINVANLQALCSEWVSLANAAAVPLRAFQAPTLEAPSAEPEQ